MVKPSVPSKQARQKSTIRCLGFLGIVFLVISSFDNNSIGANNLQLLTEDANLHKAQHGAGTALGHQQETRDIPRIQSKTENSVEVDHHEAYSGQETIVDSSSARHQSKAEVVNSVTGTANVALTSDLKSPSSKSSVPGYLMYVLTLQGVEGADESNAYRFDNFTRHWSILCNNTEEAIQRHQQQTPEEIHFHRCPGYLNPPGTRFGYGLSMAYKECFEWALEHHEQWHADHKNAVGEKGEIPFIFLEDDGRLYNSHFCHSKYRNRLWDAAPSDTTVLMLGGHNLFLQDMPKGEVENTDGYGLAGNEDVIPDFIRPRHSAGSYGFVIPKAERVAYMRRKLVKMLNRSHTPEGMVGFFAIDKQFYQYPMLKVYVTQPWLMYHEGGLWSNNKDRVRGEYGDGSRQYRWVPGLTGSFRNCSTDGAAGLNKEGNRTLESSQTAGVTDNAFQEIKVVVSCHTLTLRIPKSLILLQNSTTSKRVIAAVVSDSSRSSWRSTIRSTWGKPDGFVSDTQKGIKHTESNTFFLVGGPWEEVASEFQEHQDIVWIDEGGVGSSTLIKTLQVASFVKIVDDYLHTLYSFLLRVPDDAYPNLPRIRTQLSQNKRYNIGVWGTNCRTGLRPFHLGVPETEYSDYFFPQYCKGEAYALTQPFVRCAAAHIGETRIVSLDNAYIGLLAERCGLRATQFLRQSRRVKWDEGLLKTNITAVDAMQRRHRQQKAFW